MTKEEIERLCGVDIEAEEDSGCLVLGLTIQFMISQEQLIAMMPDTFIGAFFGYVEQSVCEARKKLTERVAQ